MQHRLGHKNFKTTYDIYSDLEQDRAVTAAVVKQLGLGAPPKKKSAKKTVEKNKPPRKLSKALI